MLTERKRNRDKREKRERRQRCRSEKDHEHADGGREGWRSEEREGQGRTGRDREGVIRKSTRHTCWSSALQRSQVWGREGVGEGRGGGKGGKGTEGKGQELDGSTRDEPVCWLLTCFCGLQEKKTKKDVKVEL